MRTSKAILAEQVFII